MKKLIKMKKILNGRSMVEMLAVLAIIGILSVGSLAAYEYAMDSNDANNIIEFVHKLATTAKIRNKTLHADDCLTEFPIESVNPRTISTEPIPPTYPDYVDSCSIDYQRYGQVTITLTYAQDARLRILTLVDQRKSHFAAVNSDLDEKRQTFTFQ